MKAALFLVACASACLDNPFGRPAPVVDGAGFPEATRMLIPRGAYLDGEKVLYFLLGPTTDAIGRVVELRDAQGAALPRCETRRKDPSGNAVELDLAACQGPLFDRLPGQAGYSPFVAVAESRVRMGYALDAVRAIEELAGAGASPPEDGGTVLDLAVVDAAAAYADPSAKVPRLLGWYRGLAVVYLQAPGEVPTAGGKVTPMELLVPEGASAGDGHDVFRARSGQPGYSPLCRVSYYRRPAGGQPGDVRDARLLGAADVRPSEPPELVHCVVP